MSGHGFNHSLSFAARSAAGSSFSGISVAGALANKIGAAMSRVIWNRLNTSMPDDDDFQDLLLLVEELNQGEDLGRKLNNQSKLCQLLEQNEELNAGKVDQVKATPVHELMSQFKKQLEDLNTEKELKIEEYLESVTEEKFMA